jgi:hypothetical protein
VVVKQYKRRYMPAKLNMYSVNEKRAEKKNGYVMYLNVTKTYKALPYKPNGKR